MEEPGEDSSRFDSVVPTVVKPPPSSSHLYESEEPIELGILRQFTFSSELQVHCCCMCIVCIANSFYILLVNHSFMKGSQSMGMGDVPLFNAVHVYMYITQHGLHTCKIMSCVCKHVYDIGCMTSTCIDSCTVWLEIFVWRKFSPPALSG